MKLIMETWKRFLKEDKDVDYAEFELAKMEPGQRMDFIEAVRDAIRLHLHPSEEGDVEYVLDRAKQPAADHLAPLVSLFLDDPGVLFDITQKFDRDDDDDYAL